MDHVDDEDNIRETQSDELHQPKTEEGDWGKQIVAYVSAAGLNSITYESLLLILVERITSK